MQDYRTDTGVHLCGACCDYMLAMRLRRVVL